MNRNLLVVIGALLVALVAYGLFFKTATREPHALLQTSGGELEWLRREFKLTDAQFTRIRTLHENYEPTCEKLCARVRAANEHLDQVVHANQTFTPAVAEALKACTAVQEDCRLAMLGHIYAVGAEMSPENGARYVRMMLPHIVQPPIRGESTQTQPHQH